MGTNHDTMWNHIAEPDRIINTPRLLKRITGRIPGQFAFILKYFEPFAPEYGSIFRWDGRWAGDPKDRCKLYL